MDPFERNPWKEFKAQDEEQKPPTRFQMAVGHLCALILILIVMLGIGLMAFLNGSRYVPPTAYNDNVFLEDLVALVCLALAAGLGLWGVAVWEEWKTRSHLERHAREVEEHLKAREETNPFAQLMDARLRDEAKKAAAGRKAKAPEKHDLERFYPGRALW